MSLRDVLVVIPCLNEEDHIGSLLTDLVADASEALIVVADGGSEDRTVDIASAFCCDWPNVRVINNPGKIQSAAINLAVERFGSGRSWLARVDAHCGYSRDFIARLVETAHRVDAASVTVPMRTVGARCFQRAVAAAQNSRLGTGGAAHRVGKVGRFVDHGHHALMSLELFKKAGGYCEELSHNEDAELDIRLAAVGARIWLEPALEIIYYPRATPAALFRQYSGYGTGRARTMLRHRRRLRVRQALPLGVAPSIVIGLGAVIWPWLAAPTIAWAALCLLWGLGLAAKSRRGCEIGSGIAAMIMHLGWSFGFWKACTLRALGREQDHWNPRFHSHLEAATDE